jgi:hypothetical protein
MNDHDLKQLWKEQPMTPAAFSLDDLKIEARRVHRRIAIRNATEYAACAVVVCVFSFYAYRFPYSLMRIGSLLTVFATLFIAWQMKRRASGQSLPTAQGGQSWLEFQRSQLVRQRDALRSAWLWYVAPFLPGVAVFRLGVETQLPANGPFARGWLANLFIAGVFVGIAVLNRYTARKLQRRIDELDQQAG